MLKFLFQTIRFRIRTSFSFICPTDKTLSGATFPGHSGSGSDGNTRVLCIPHRPCISEKSDSETIRLFSIIPRILVSGGLIFCTDVFCVCCKPSRVISFNIRPVFGGRALPLNREYLKPFNCEQKMSSCI